MIIRYIQISIYSLLLSVPALIYSLAFAIGLNFFPMNIFFGPIWIFHLNEPGNIEQGITLISLPSLYVIYGLVLFASNNKGQYIRKVIGILLIHYFSIAWLFYPPITIYHNIGTFIQDNNTILNIFAKLSIVELFIGYHILLYKLRKPTANSFKISTVMIIVFVVIPWLYSLYWIAEPLLYI
jgi:hypothetical protein